MVDLKQIFPQTPSLAAEWAPVFFEPLQGSGERLTIAVAARTLDGVGAAQLSVRKRALRCMYGPEANRVIGLAELVVESLSDHLEDGSTFQTWLPPTSSCHMGTVRPAYGDSLESVIFQAIKLTASLADQVMLDAPADTLSESANLQVDRFLRQVQRSVKERVSEFQFRFNQSINVREGAEPTRIGYLGNRMAANFDVLVPGSTLPSRRRNAKAKLVDLQVLKDSYDMFSGERNAYELMLWTPQVDVPLFSKRDIEKTDAVFLELSDFGDNHDIRIHKAASPEEAATRIIKAEGFSALA